MGSAFRKGGGGILNHLDSTITDIQFTDEFNGKPFVPGINPKTKKEKFHSLYAVVSFKIDGSTTVTPQHLFAGDFDAFEISEDGHSLTPVEEGYQLGGGTGLAKFIESLVEAGYEAADPGDEAPFDFTSLIGIRVRTEQRVNAELTGERGKRKYTGKDGKERETAYTDLVVETFYSGPEAKKAAGKVTRTAQAAPSKANGKAAKGKTPDVVDVAETAAQALLGYLQDAPNTTLPKAKLRTRVLTDPTFKGDPALAKEVATWLANDENLGGIEEIVYNEDTGLIVVV